MNNIFKKNIITIKKSQSDKKNYIIYLFGRWKDNKYYINWSNNINTQNIIIYYNNEINSNNIIVNSNNYYSYHNEGLFIKKQEVNNDYFYFYFSNLDKKNKYNIYVEMGGIKSNILYI